MRVDVKLSGFVLTVTLNFIVRALPLTLGWYQHLTEPLAAMSREDSNRSGSSDMHDYAWIPAERHQHEEDILNSEDSVPDVFSSPSRGSGVTESSSLRRAG